MARDTAHNSVVNTCSSCPARWGLPLGPCGGALLTEVKAAPGVSLGISVPAPSVIKGQVQG